jgi:hypothetical protein
VTQFWNYKADNVWKQQTTHRLCQGNLATIVDVCYNVSQNALYWCQRQESETDGKITYSIFKRVIIEGNFKTCYFVCIENFTERKTPTF